MIEIFFAIIVCFVSQTVPAAQENADSTPSKQNSATHVVANVGYPEVLMGVHLPGPLLTAKPIEDRDQPVILRILATYKHGDDHRYDLEFIGLDPGTYDLADYLQRDDGEPVQNLPEINVRIESLLPPGQVEPHEIIQRQTWFGSYYLAALLIGGALWFLGLFAILFSGRYRIRRPSREEKIVTVADRLKPLVDQAIAGEMSANEQAELERVLVAFWRKKLRLGHLPADRLRVQLREHPQASVLLEQIDNWLHRPDSDNNVNVAELLNPYQSLNYDEI